MTLSCSKCGKIAGRKAYRLDHGLVCKTCYIRSEKGLQTRFGSYAYNINYRRKNKKSFEITFEQWKEKIHGKPCYYCGEPLPPVGLGMDRIDNARGYDYDNVIPACTECNRSRGSRYSVDEFKVMMTALKSYRMARRMNNARG